MPKASGSRERPATLRSLHVMALCVLAVLPLLGTGCKHATAARPARPAARSTPGAWPVSSPNMLTTSRFGEARAPARRHKGIDFSVPLGTPVHATADGVVAFSGAQGAYGELVVLRHASDYETAYAHLQKRLVRETQYVRQGEVVGKAGKSGNATGVHLHYEVRRHGECVNPEPYLPRRQAGAPGPGNPRMGSR